MQPLRSIISGTGSYIPAKKIPNSHFQNHTFLDNDGSPFDKSNTEIIEKFSEITGIQERRYAADNVLASDMGTEAGKKAIESAGLDPEAIDYIVVAHNFGDVRANNPKVDMVPSLASRIKHNLGISNPQCIAYDLPFGCPGWVQGLIQCDYYLRSGDASACLVIGTEILSRICDPHDRDSMIFADGAGAALMEARQSSQPTGILSHAARTDAGEETYFLSMAPSNNPDYGDSLFIKMDGHKLYQYALRNVPQVVKAGLDKAGLEFEDVHKVLLHQANAKMDSAIMERVAGLYDIEEIPADIMPMTISKLGNTSVATIPTMFDLILRGKMDNHHINENDIVIFSSVGAGMNINSVVYKMPQL